MNLRDNSPAQKKSLGCWRKGEEDRSERKSRCRKISNAYYWPDREIMQEVLALITSADDPMRHPDDKSSICLLLCRSYSKIEVEYALRRMQKPIGAASWEMRLVKTLPEELKSSLPRVAEIEAELEWVDGK